MYWSAVDREIDQKLVELFANYSITDKTEWRVASVKIPIENPTVGKVINFNFDISMTK